MLFTYLFRDPAVWTIPMIIQIICYYRILGKMGKRKYFAIIPILGDMEMSTDLFRKMRSFWRPAAITIAMFLTSRYLGMNNMYSIVMGIVALIVYGVFLIRLYSRLAKQFGRGRLFALGLILMPVIFLALLAFGKKNVYLGKPEFRPERELSPTAAKIRKAGMFAVSAAELAALVTGCFVITMIVHPFRPMVKYMINEINSDLKNVTDSDEIVGRDVTLGADYEAIVEKQRTRDYFFPDHSGVKKVVVMEYIIGSNLEDDRGMASINIAQMKDATAKGDGVDFVMQAGGSGRWFTSGIEDATVGRYLISGGKIETAELLDSTTCMSEPESLTDFIKWTKKNYPADRYMLVLWDHGGGFASGYGVDGLNDRAAEDEETMKASEIIDAIKKADMKFDVIGFDACLMQNVEYANALEPYADYYLASEETEPGTGWFYTAGFGKLAEDPTLSTEEFSKSMISSYDQSQRARNSGEPDHSCTLSLVDLTLVKPVYEQLTDFYEKAMHLIEEKPSVYANMSAARSGSYQFSDEEQTDLVSYMTNLKKADYKQLVTTDEELDRIADTAKACVVYRNSDSAEGINGLAIDFPYKDLTMYKYEYAELKAVNYKKEQDFFDRFCSIMGAQQKKATSDDSFFGIPLMEDYSDEEWYIEGFEDYDTADAFVDIPVKEVEGGYLPELPDKTWDTILDCRIATYLVTDEGLMYIGQEHFSENDDEGHPVVSMDGIWAHLNGHVVCYEAEEPQLTEEGLIFRGKIKAKLNETENITLHIEWDPVKEDSDDEPTGWVTGYSKDDEKVSFFMKKGLEQFETGDMVEFMFDFYDEEGNLIKTDTYGDPMLVITEDQMKVRDEEFESGTVLSYFGILTDIYQRDLMTEEIREQVQ